MADFEERLTALIHRFALETGSDTPDFILASYMNDCLKAFNIAVKTRSEYYGGKSHGIPYPFEREEQLNEYKQNFMNRFKANELPYPFETNQELGINLGPNKLGTSASKIPDNKIVNPGAPSSTIVLTSGEPVPQDRSHTAIDPETGQQQAYVVLSEEERAKGFVRPYRDKYKHLKCGAITTMSRSIAETYARDPEFYSGTFCVECKQHYTLDQFVWAGTNIQVGS